jgi:hypothetical protein
MAPCSSFAAVEDLPEGCPCRSFTSGDSEPDEDTLTELLAAASLIVWGLLGRQPIGLCEVTIHPCLRANHWRWHWFSRQSPEFGGVLPSCACSDDAVLLDGPVDDVISVVVNGEELDSSEYVLLDGLWLERINGSWPTGGEPGGATEFSITYDQGIPVDSLVRDATIEVANALWMDRCGVASCLPGKAVTSMSQAGTSYSYETDMERVKAAGEALSTTWRAIGVYNPTQQQVPTFVYSPDEPYRNRRVRTFT